MKVPAKNKSNENQQGYSTSNQNFQSIKDSQKQRGISNSGGQLSFQTDNKQANVNRGNVNPAVQGKEQGGKSPSKHSPK